MKKVLWNLLPLLLGLSAICHAQNTDDDDDDDDDDDTIYPDYDETGYHGYNLMAHGDAGAAAYNTEQTHTGIDLLSPVPDVYLNASVHVGLISILVANITAKVNLDAKVLNLLHFSAGVDASIDKVQLTIENISAEVELEARLENVVAMVSDVLHSIDLNPIIATLGKDVNKIVNNLTDTLGQEVDENGNPVEGSSGGNGGNGGGKQNGKRDLGFPFDENILYSINDYSGQTHTNRILAQNGSLIDIFLDNKGDEHGRKVVGYYKKFMEFTGHNRTISVDGKVKEFELQYIYRPYPGLEVTSYIYVNKKGKVTRTQVIAEVEGGGTSHISDDDDDDDEQL
jgi:hypothetical protein